MIGKKTIGFSVASILSVGLMVSAASAHFIWIETPSENDRKKEQKAALYFGEYQEFLREEAGGRLDLVDAVKAWAIDPKGTRQALSLEKKTNHFVSTLSPSCLPGRYHILAENTEAEVQDLTKHDIGIVKPQFYARGQFFCVEDGRISEREKEVEQAFEMDIIPISKGVNLVKGDLAPRLGGEVVVKVYFKKEPLAKTALLVHSPLGWDKEMHTDSQGIASFTPLWPGQYVLELVHLEKAPGEFKGKKYNAVRHRATTTIQVTGERKMAEK
jgi:hypothetical protein